MTDGTPFAAILKKSPRLPRAWEMTLVEMKKGERRILKITPEFGFQHKECEYHLPLEAREDEKHDLTVDLQLLNWYGSRDVMSTMASTSESILKRVLVDGVGYENPRPPYKVRALITLRSLSSDGIQQKGEVLFATRDDAVEVAMGDDSVPSGIQACLGSMVQGEHAVCIFSNDTSTETHSASSIFPSFPKNLQQIEAEIKVLRVIQVRDIYGDGKIMKYRIVDGKGSFPSDCPLQDCCVNIHHKVRAWIQSANGDTERRPEWVYDSKQEKAEPFAIDLGCGDLPVGLEACIRLMLPGELSRIECKADVAYSNPNTRCSVPVGISAGDDVEFEVELFSFQKGMQWVGISTAEALQEAQKMKDIANGLYKEGATELAANKYKLIVNQLSSLRDFETDEQIQEADGLRFACFSNLASCAIQDAEFTTAIDWCNKALRLNDQNVKVLLRRAKAYSLYGDFEEAENDLKEVERLDPDLKSEVEAIFLKNKQRKKAAALKQKQQFRNFFDRS